MERTTNARCYRPAAVGVVVDVVFQNKKEYFECCCCCCCLETCGYLMIVGGRQGDNELLTKNRLDDEETRLQTDEGEFVVVLLIFAGF